MLSNTNLPQGPLYDPKSAVLKFRFDEDLENLRFNLLGTGTLYNDPNFHYKLESDMEWRRPKEICDRPYFIKGKPSRFDAIQGYLGDCWLMAGMIALACHEKVIAHVVPSDQSFDHDYIGAFHFRIWQLGTWYDVVVDDRLPVFKKNKHFVYSYSLNRDVFWAPLLEKAYAKVCGFTYASVVEGYPNTGLQDFSGGITQMVPLYALPAGTTIKWFISQVFSGDAFICCSCFKYVEFKRDHLFSIHVYTITNVFQCSDDDPDYPGLFLLRIMNPHGRNEWQGEWSDNSRRWDEIDQKIRQKLDIVSWQDGEFWMDESDFVRYFNKLYVCYLGPGQYVESRHGVNVGTWRTTTFTGEWRAPYNAGGSSLSSRHQNPQYRIVLDRLDNDSDRDGLCSVVIELTQRSRSKRIIMKNIGCYIYSLTNVINPPLPLNYDFFQNHNALNEDDMTFSDEGRGFVVSMKLEPGKYCIVPCTQKPNEDQQFLLRVYSESLVEMWEYDTQISKSLPEEEGNLRRADDKLLALFYDASDGQDEINWIGLQEILNKTMNPHNIFSSVIGIFIKFTWDILETFLPLSPFDDLVTSEIVFSKDDCRSMIAMLDDNHSGKLSFSEFSNLWNKVMFWCRVYRENCEGHMPVSQLKDALSSIGYNVNTRLIHTLIHLYANEEETITLEDYVLCGVVLETTMSLHQKMKADSGNKYLFNLEEWVKQTLFL